MGEMHSDELAAAQIVTVDLGARSYRIEIGAGLLGQTGAIIAALAPRAKCAVVTDENVAALHLETLQESLKSAEAPALPAIVLPPGENSKRFPVAERLCERLLELGVERRDLVIALGGGVIGDLAGFAASILRRGAPVVQIPTTLLAQVDSSIGGKTGVNTAQGKNLVGTFHQPSLVIADTDVLDTLPPREFRAGYAEVVKYGLLGDAPFFSWLEANRERIFHGNDPAARSYAIGTSCRAKAEIVAGDELETGQRGLLNLGHTFGHALEAWAGYGDLLLHGEAVAIGMTLAFELSEEMGLCPAGAAERVAAHLRAAGLRASISDLANAGAGLPEAGALIGHMTQDKKVKGGRMTFVLARGVGDAFLTQDVDLGRLERFLGPRCANR
jgi:3-dehydroquinate synthase